MMFLAWCIASWFEWGFICVWCFASRSEVSKLIVSCQSVWYLSCWVFRQLFFVLTRAYCSTSCWSEILFVLGFLAVSSCCIGVLLADLDDLLRSKISLLLKADSELPRFVISFVLGVLPIVLYSRLYLVFC